MKTIIRLLINFLISVKEDHSMKMLIVHYGHLVGVKQQDTYTSGFWPTGWVWEFDVEQDTLAGYKAYKVSKGTGKENTNTSLHTFCYKDDDKEFIDEGMSMKDAYNTNMATKEIGGKTFQVTQFVSEYTGDCFQYHVIYGDMEFDFYDFEEPSVDSMIKSINTIEQIERLQDSHAIILGGRDADDTYNTKTKCIPYIANKIMANLSDPI